MPYRPPLLFVAAGLAVACVIAPVAAQSAPATQSAPGSAPAPASATAPALDPEVEAWLDRIEARADELDTLRAGLRYTTVQGLLGDRQIRFGTLAYAAGPPARFAAQLDRVVVDDALRPQDQRFIFDGRWLAERKVDGAHKTFIRRELVAEDQVGQDLLRLGEGPFALPLDLQKQAVVERFDVSLVKEAEPESEDEGLANAVHLRLVPKEHLNIAQDQIDLWYDRETLLPLQVRTLNEDAEEASYVRLFRLEPNAELEAGTFDTTPPREPGWEVEVQPLRPE